jgi:hypothetical protein
MSETLHNGISLPDAWPPRNLDPLSREPTPVPYLLNPPAVIPIDTGRQLFVDSFLVSQTSMVRRFHLADKFEGNPVLKPETALERPADGNPCAAPKSGGVWYDPRDRHFKMWYETGWLHALAYAVSPDGLTWDRPRLNPATGDNRILPDLRPDSGAVFLDETSETERFKIMVRPPNFAAGGGSAGAHLAVSADGIHWGKRVRTGPMGDRSSFFLDPFRRRWVYSIRASCAHGRCRKFWDSPDFLAGAAWDKDTPVWWAFADDRDEPGDSPAQLYNLDAVGYESLMLGLFEIHKGPPNDACEVLGMPKVTELSLAYSRDGFHWHRPDRRAFIPCRREPGSWEYGYVQSVGGVCLIEGDQLRFYYSAFAGDPARRTGGSPTNGMYANGATGIATLRRDGFASMQARLPDAQLTTRPVRFTGERLFVNADTAGGNLRVECLAEDGSPILPFTADTCVPFAGNSTRAMIRWTGADSLAALRDRPIRFRFHLTRGDLYAFWVSPSARGESRGCLAAGGPGLPGLWDR